MGSLWLRIKVWTKSIIFFAVLLYAIIFFFENSGESVKFWYWFDHTHQTSMLVLMLVTFAIGVISTILVRTTFTTIRQIRDLRTRGRIDRLEREHSEMKSRAAMLQTRTSAPPPTSAPTSTTSDEP